MDTTKNGLEVVITNVDVWQGSRFTRREILGRLRNVKAIRINEVYVNQIYTTLPVFSWFPTDRMAVGNFERLHALVNDGDFSVFSDKTDDMVFAVIFMRKLVEWLSRTELQTAKAQICHWLAAQLTLRGRFPGPVDSCVKEEAEDLVAKHYSDFRYEQIWGDDSPEVLTQFTAHYKKTSETLTAGMPEFLELFEHQTLSCDLRSWGLQSGFDGIRFPTIFPYRRRKFFSVKSASVKRRAGSGCPC